MDSAGNVFVTDNQANRRVQKFTDSGTYLTQWGGIDGTGNGEFDSPTGITVDDLGIVKQ